MKIDFSQKIQGPNGEEGNIDLALVACEVLNIPIGVDRQPLPLGDAVRRGNLALQLAKGGEQDLTPEDAAMIRSILPLGGRQNFIVARAAKMLEG